VRFQRHGVRKRLFRFFVQEVIEEVGSYLTRWKCPLCRRTYASGVRTEEGAPFSHADAEAGRELVARAYRALFEVDHFPVFETDSAFR